MQRDTFWYEDFLEYWKESYGRTVLYVEESKSWVQYQGGVFIPLPKNGYAKLIVKWFTLTGKKFSNQKKGEVNTILKTEYFVSSNDFDTNLNIRNVKNGLLYMDQTDPAKNHLEPHTPNYLSRLQTEVSYYSQEELQPTKYWDIVLKMDTEALEWILWFWRTVLYRQMENEKALFIVGKKRSGKGTLTTVFESFFSKPSLSHQGLANMHPRFGLQPLVNREMDLVKESSVSRLNPIAIKWFKSIVGRDGTLSVDKKVKDAYDYDFKSFFFYICGNYTYQYPMIDADSFFSRWCAVEYVKMFDIIDPKFKDNLLTEKDMIFSQLIHQGYETFAEAHLRIRGVPYELDAWICEMQTTWKKWSEPIAMVCNDMFICDTSAEYLMEQTYVLDEVSVALTEGDFYIPRSKRTFISKLKIALKNIHISSHRIQGGDYQFRNIRFRNIERQLEYDIEQEENANYNETNPVLTTY